MEDGCPVAIPRLLEAFGAADVPNFVALKEAHGLKALYARSGVTRDFEHICGGRSIE